jgi:hypothetical protein
MIKPTFFLVTAYMIFDYIRFSLTGVPDAKAVLVGQVGGAILGFYFWYVFVPMFIFKKARKFFASSTASAVAQQLPVSAIDNSGQC